MNKTSTVLYKWSRLVLKLNESKDNFNLLFFIPFQMFARAKWLYFESSFLKPKIFFFEPKRESRLWKGLFQCTSQTEKKMNKLLQKKKCRYLMNTRWQATEQDFINFTLVAPIKGEDKWKKIFVLKYYCHKSDVLEACQSTFQILPIQYINRRIV